MRRIGDDALVHLLNQGSDKQDTAWEPDIDVYETASQLIIKASLAGVVQSSIELILSEDFRSITIKGERRERCKPQPVRYYRLGIYYGSFEKTISIPQGIYIKPNSAHAVFEDGILIIELDKKDNISTSISIDD